MEVLKILDDTFLEHPRDRGMSYFYHFYVSMNLSASFFIAGSQAFIHGICPKLFETSSSEWVKILKGFIDENSKKEN